MRFSLTCHTSMRLDLKLRPLKRKVWLVKGRAFAARSATQELCSILHTARHPSRATVGLSECVEGLTTPNS
jgi:hypothetical protein